MSAVLVAAMNCCAQACTVNATAVPSRPVMTIARTSRVVNCMCGCSISGTLRNISVAAVMVCRNAICSKGWRRVARPKKDDLKSEGDGAADRDHVAAIHAGQIAEPFAAARRDCEQK